MIVADVSFADIFWSILWCYFLFLWIMVLFHILGDLFRDHPVRGDQDPVGAVPGLPTLPGRAGLPAHPGEGMAERAAPRQHQAQEQFDGYVRTVATTGDAAAPRRADRRAKQLLDAGTIDQAEFDRLKAKALA